MKFVDNPGWPV